MIGQHLQLFSCLNDHQVEYLLIGGTLAIAYGVPRTTKDIDIFLRPSIENAELCLKALRQLDFKTAELTTAQDICNMEITVLKDFIRLDILTQVKGIEFEHAWNNKVVLELDSVHIPSLSLQDLINAKTAAGRPGDLEDVKILELARDNMKS